MKHSTLIPVDRIEKAIFLIRGEKVMLDRDLAELYQVETRVLNQAVGRNRDRFPPDFAIELTREEIMEISQIVTSSNLRFSKRVTVFTEQGVAMLSSVLRSYYLSLLRCEITFYFPLSICQPGFTHCPLRKTKTSVTRPVWVICWPPV